MLFKDARLHHCLGLGQLDPIVDAERLGRVVEHNRFDRAGTQLLHRHRHQVGQIILAA